MKKSNPKGTIAKTPKVAVVITNWNGKKDTIECIDSLLKSTYKNFKIIVVDNGSIDESEADIKAKFSEVEIVHIKENVGIAAANNVGITASLELGNVKYIILSNNDVIYDAYCLEELVKEAEKHPEVAVTTPLIYHYYEPKLVWTV